MTLDLGRDVWLLASGVLRGESVSLREREIGLGGMEKYWMR